MIFLCYQHFEECYPISIHFPRYPHVPIMSQLYPHVPVIFPLFLVPNYFPMMSPLFLQYKVVMYFHYPMIPALKKHTYIPIIYPFFASPLFPNCPKICTEKNRIYFHFKVRHPSYKLVSKSH